MFRSQTTVHFKALRDCSPHKSSFTTMSPSQVIFQYRSLPFTSHHSLQISQDCFFHKSSFITVHFNALQDCSLHKSSFTPNFTRLFLSQVIFHLKDSQYLFFTSHCLLQRFTRLLPSQATVHFNSLQECCLHKSVFIPTLHRPVRFTSHRSFQSFTSLFASQVTVHSNSSLDYSLHKSPFIPTLY